MDVDLFRHRVAVRLDVGSCRACDLSKHARPVLFHGPTPARFVIVGEAPSTVESRRREPFVGPAGLLLRNMLRQAKIPLDDIVLVNAVSCQAFGTPTREHVEACHGNLMAQLELADTPHIVAAGMTALTALIPDAKNVGRLHGAVLKLGEWNVMPVFHPSYILRNKSNWQKRKVIDCLETMDALSKGFLDPEWLAGPTCAECDKKAEVWDERMMPYCPKHQKAIKTRKLRTKRELKARWLAAQGDLFDMEGLTQ